MGIATKLIGVFFCVTGFLTLFYGSTLAQPLNTVLYFVGLFIMVMGFTFLTTSRPINMPRPPPPTYTEVHCDNAECNFKEIRSFEKGDYVLKPLTVRCPKCGGSLTIQGIYIEKEEVERAGS